MTTQNGLNDMIGNLIDYSMDQINCMYLGKIIKLTPPYARIQPLAMIDNQKQNPVDKVPFLTLPLQYKSKYEDSNGNSTSKKELSMKEPKLAYKVGDNVICGVLNVDNMYFKNKNTFKVDSSRRHSLDFSVVLGKYASKDDFKAGDDNGS